MRTFETGATRDNEVDKLDYEGFLSPLVLECYAQYMHEHRIQKDGKYRASDNWQQGIPLSVYMKSMWRHFMEVWKLHRGGVLTPTGVEALENALCALLFNVMGYLHEFLKGKRAPAKVDPETTLTALKLSLPKIYKDGETFNVERTWVEGIDG